MRGSPRPKAKTVLSMSGTSVPIRFGSVSRRRSTQVRRTAWVRHGGAVARGLRSDLASPAAMDEQDAEQITGDPRFARCRCSMTAAGNNRERNPRREGYPRVPDRRLCAMTKHRSDHLCGLRLLRRARECAETFSADFTREQ